MRRGIQAAFALAALLMVPGTVLAADSGKWEGWIVGKSCVEELHIVDCPLSLIGEPVLLLENGGHVAFHYGDATAVKHTDIDAAYGRKVRLLGEMKDGAVVPVRMEMLETVGEKKFFKGCL